MNILFLNKFNDHWKSKYDILRKEFPETEFTAIFNPEERLRSLKNADAVITGRLLESEIEGSKKLQVIFVPFTGLNNFPLEIIRKKNITIANTHANARFVAERAVTLAITAWESCGIS